MYVTMCRCGKEIRSTCKEGTCHSCGVAWRLEWPTPAIKASPQPKTISDKYDEEGK
jgi:hypothetical protein